MSSQSWWISQNTTRALFCFIWPWLKYNQDHLLFFGLDQVGQALPCLPSLKEKGKTNKNQKNKKTKSWHFSAFTNKPAEELKRYVKKKKHAQKYCEVIYGFE